MLTLWACYWEVICRLLGVAALLLATPAIAGEGGGAHYNPGTQGDFGIALLGPPGFYLRNDFFFFDGDIGPVTLGRFILEEARQKAWVNVVKSGQLFHIDYHLAQHFSPRFAVGFDGYWLQQTTKDEGPLIDQANAIGRLSGGFKEEGVGIGGSLKWTPKILGRA